MLFGIIINVKSTRYTTRKTIGDISFSNNQIKVKISKMDWKKITSYNTSKLELSLTGKYLQGELPMLEQDRFVSGGEYGGSDAESGGLSGIPEIPCLESYEMHN